MSTIEDYKLELQSKKAELATLLFLLTQGKSLMLELAAALDGTALAGEPFPDELNQRVRRWTQANWALPLTDVLPENKRYVDGQFMHWAGLPVWVDGIVTTAPGNWPSIDANDMSPRGDDPPPVDKSPTP